MRDLQPGYPMRLANLGGSYRGLFLARTSNLGRVASRAPAPLPVARWRNEREDSQKSRAVSGQRRVLDGMATADAGQLDAQGNSPARRRRGNRPHDAAAAPACRRLSPEWSQEKAKLRLLPI